MSVLYDQLKQHFSNLRDVEFEIRQYEMVLEGVDENSAEWVRELAEGPTLEQCYHAKARIEEEINNLLLQEGSKMLQADYNLIEVSP